MKRSIPILTLIAFLGGLGAAYAGGGGAAADRLRDPNGRGMGMSVSQYNKTMKQRRVKGMPPGQTAERPAHCESLLRGGPCRRATSAPPRSEGKHTRARDARSPMLFLYAGGPASLARRFRFSASRIFGGPV